MVEGKNHRGEVRENTTVAVPLHHGAVKTPPRCRQNSTMVEWHRHHGEISKPPWCFFYSTMVFCLTSPWWRISFTMVEFRLSPWWNLVKGESIFREVVQKIRAAK